MAADVCGGAPLTAAATLRAVPSDSGPEVVTTALREPPNA